MLRTKRLELLFQAAIAVVGFAWAAACAYQFYLCGKRSGSPAIIYAAMVESARKVAGGAILVAPISCLVGLVYKHASILRGPS